MNLQEWRAKRNTQKEISLPSGLDVIVKPVTVQDLVVQGRIPETLFSTIDDLTGKAQTGQLDKGLKTSELSAMAQLILAVCRAALVEPEGLDAAELPFEDQLAIFNWANGGAAQMVPFPKKRPNVDVASTSNRKRVRGATVVRTGV